MMLRNFLYLDTDTLSNYLSTLEGYEEIEIDDTSTQHRKGGGKVSVKIVEGSGEAENITSRKRRLGVTDEGRFQRLYEILDRDSDGGIPYLEAFDSALWTGLQRGSIVEVQADLQLPAIVRQLQSFEAATPLLEVLKLVGQDPLSDPDSQTAIQGMLAVSKTLDEKPLPLLYHPVAAGGYRFFASLVREHLRCDPAELSGEATVFGKILRFIEKGKKETVFSLIPDITAAQSTNRKQRRKLERGKNQLVETIKGPAAIMAVTAIYR